MLCHQGEEGMRNLDIKCVKEKPRVGNTASSELSELNLSKNTILTLN